MSFAPLQGIFGQSSLGLPVGSNRSLSDMQLRFMEAPANVPSALWRTASVDERRALIETAPAPRVQLADASGGRIGFQTPRPSGPMQSIPADTVARAFDAGERSIGMRGLSLKDAAKALLRGAAARATTIAGAVLIPTNRTEPFTYQFASDLRARQPLGERALHFEKQVNGEWQRMAARAEAGPGGTIRVDAQQLQREYGKPLPQPLAPSAAKTDRDDPKLCKDLGQWTRDPGYASNSANSRAYQDHISGRPGQHFVVKEPMRSKNEIAFDGCRDTAAGPVLLEAKAKHDMIDKDWFRGGDAMVDQANQQSLTATRLGARLEWHAQTKPDVDALNELFRENGVPVRVQHTPTPIVK